MRDLNFKANSKGLLRYSEAAIAILFGHASRLFDRCIQQRGNQGLIKQTKLRVLLC